MLRAPDLSEGTRVQIGAALLCALRADIDPACELSRCVCESGKGGCC